jgi:penicillin-binding protein 2
MTELRNVDAELGQFRTRITVAGVFVLLAFAVLASRMVYLQVLRHEELLEQAETNRTTILPVVPQRGQILDRNGKVLATNYSAYTLEITPSKVKDINATIEALSTLVNIEARDKRRFRQLLQESRLFDSVPIRTRLSDDEVARFAAQRFRFPGVDIKARLFRQYPNGEVGSHAIGYIGRINQREKADIQAWS